MISLIRNNNDSLIFDLDNVLINNNNNNNEDGKTSNVCELVERCFSAPNEKVHGEIIRKAVDVILKDAVFNGTKKHNKVLEWRNPDELKSILDLNLDMFGVNDTKILNIIHNVIKYSVKTGHPYFVNQLFSSVDPYGLIGQWLTDALNPSVYTYEVAPVFTLMEEEVLREMRRIVGYPNGNGDGIFCPGGSIANGYAINCARYRLNPDIKRKGLYSIGRLVLFTSRDAHYSIVKMSSLLGIGSENVYLVDTDDLGKMKPSHLEQLIHKSLEEGAVPFMVSATAGTTVLGAFDPIDKLADICKRHKLWLHVDAAWGGGALMSQKYKHLLHGIHSADSVTWNPHKLLAAPQQCSLFLTTHTGILSSAHSANADYLFQKDKFYNTKYDTGDKSIQCGRRADVFKFWLMWKAKGTNGLEMHVNKVFDNAEYFKNKIEKRKNFKLVLENPQCTNVCFWYIPPSLADMDIDNPDYLYKLHKVAPRIKERMMKNGSMMVTYQPLRELPNFFRLVLQNSVLEHTDMDYFIKIFESYGADL